MSRIFYSKEVEELNKVEKLYDKQKNKKWDFKIEDFEIDNTDFSFKHNTWETWCIGGNTVDETKLIINRYITETKKPYMQSDLSFIHLKPM